MILGGTTEATALAEALAGDARFDTLLSFAGTTRAPRPPPVAYRVGGFGGVDGLAEFLRREGIGLLIDATHPFAARMKRNALDAARISDVPLLGILRPAWRNGDWTHVADMAGAAEALGQVPRRVLLTIGQKDLAAFKAAPWHSYIVRSVDPPDPASMPPNAVAISARGPFALDAERALLARIGVSVLVTKNSGGSATFAKLQAAQEAGVAVVMIDRPAPPIGVETVVDAAAAWHWLDRHAATDRRV